MMKKFHWLTLTLLISSPLCVAAQPTAPQWYQVEMIVFQQLSPQAFNSELWPSAPELPNTQGALDLSPVDQTLADPAFQLLPDQDLTLNSEAQRLENSHKYKVLLHLAWRQPVTSAKWAQEVHIYGGDVYDQNGSVIVLNQPWENADHVELQAPIAPINSIWQINGTLKVSKKKFFQVNANLVMNLPAQEVAQYSENAAKEFNQPLDSFRLVQSLRMRENELHYIDHPLYGVLINITPYTPDAT